MLFIWDVQRNITTISDVNECNEESHKCSPQAICKNEIGSYRCDCKDGFKGDGYVCSGTYTVYSSLPNEVTTNVEFVWNKIEIVFKLTFVTFLFLQPSQ